MCSCIVRINGYSVLYYIAGRGCIIIISYNYGKGYIHVIIRLYIGLTVFIVCVFKVRCMHVNIINYYIKLYIYYKVVTVANTARSVLTQYVYCVLCTVHSVE